MLSGLAGSFPVNASPARTAAVAGAGGRTQLSSLAAAAAVVVLVPAAGALRDVPVATLGAILLFIASRIFHVRDLLAVERFDLFEFGLAMVTMLTVALVGVQQGIGLAVVLAILDRTRLSARPSVHVLGRFPGTTSWGPIGTEGAREVDGVLVVLFAAPLYYANALHFRTQLRQAVESRGSIGTFVLDTVGMHDIDFTGTRVLGRLLDDLDRRRVAVAVARCGAHLRENLERSGLLQRIGADHVYANVDEAVVSMGGGPPAAS